VAIDKYVNSRDPSEVRGYISAPTGSGKTVLFVRYLEDLRAHSTKPIHSLIIVPTKQLVRQTLDALDEHGFQGKFRQVEGWRRDTGDAEILVGTYAGFVRYFEQGVHAINPDFYRQVIFDEAHHLQGEQTQRIIRERFSHAALLGFTATPDYDENRQLVNILPDEIYNISTHEAVEEGLIAPFTTGLLFTKTDISAVRVQNQDYKQEDLERALNKEIRNELIAQFYVDNLSGKRALFNTSTVAHAEGLAESLRQQGVNALAIHGKITKRQQEAILKGFHSGRIMALTQARLLGEGYDEPRIEIVINASPTLSLVRAKQRAGRAQRLDPDNTEKTTLIIECIDQNYRRLPLLYGDSRVAGEWQVTPNGLNNQAESLMSSLQTYTIPGVSVLTDVEEIAGLYREGQWLASSPMMRWGECQAPFKMNTLS
jgi:superfamily II DNA or RNA helicase